MFTRSRSLAATLIVCALLQGFQHGANAQDYQSYERAVESMRLAQQAEALYDAGRHDEALPLAERAVALEGDKYVQLDVRYSNRSPYSILGRVYRAKGDYTRAEATYLRLLKLMGGPPNNYLDSFAAARVYNELAAVYEAKGDYARALQSRMRGNELIELNLVKTLAPSVRAQPDTGDPWEALRNRSTLEVARLSGWEYYRQFILDSLVAETNAVVSLNTRYLQQDKQAAELAMTILLQRKGRLLDTMAGQLAVLRRYGNEQDQQLINRLTTVYVQSASSAEANRTSLHKKLEELQKAIAEQRPTAKIQSELETEIKLSFLGPGGSFSGQQKQIEIEGAVSRRSAELRKPEPLITLNAIKQALPADAALVEFIFYKPFNAKALTSSEVFGEPRYAAYVLRRDDVAPRWVELGDAASIEESVNQLRMALRDPQRTDVKELARSLYDHVMKPVRGLAGNARRIFLAPDGALNLFPFSVLIDEKNQFLIENYSINYLTSGRDLLRLQNMGESRDGPRVFANPRFDLTAGTQPVSGGKLTDPLTNQNMASVAFKDLMNSYYKPLPGTAAEAAALGRLFPNAMLLTDARATEASLKSVSRPSLLHIATHGFFLADKSYSARRTQEQGATSRTEGGIDPLLQSGLILAGVKQGTSGTGEDGVLTALEVAGLDLWGTRLVVLSACETGVGGVRNGEGVYGLRRALVLAGSETQVMSLWKVSDGGTRDLMVAYFTLLQKGESRVEAMRKVQQAMLRGELLPGSGKNPLNPRDTGESSDVTPAKDYRHPYYWAAFITSGDWRNLHGQEAQSR